jgi:hypothetical protein
VTDLVLVSCSAIFYPGTAEIDINNYNPYLVGNVFALFTPLGPLVPVTLYGCGEYSLLI